MKPRNRHRWSLLTAVAIGVLPMLVWIGATQATERGWKPVIVTGSLPPEQPQSSRSRTPRKSSQSQPVDTAAAPATDVKPTQMPAASNRAPVERPRGVTAAELSPAQQYCTNIADAAADARFAWQKKALEDTELEIEKRIAKLEAKTAEYQRWLARRDEFAKRAQESLVGIYTRMRPDAAALQLAASDEETAAAVLLKLDTRTSSAILAEMEPNQAARLAMIMSGAGKIQPASNTRAVTDGKRS